MENWQEYEPQIEQLAKNLSRGDSDLYEDLVQEMRIALWEAQEGQTLAWYLSRAKTAALDSLRKWKGWREKEVPIPFLPDNQQAKVNNQVYGIYEGE